MRTVSLVEHKSTKVANGLAVRMLLNIPLVLTNIGIVHMEFDPAAAADIAQRSTKIPIDLTSRYKKTIILTVTAVSPTS